MTAVALPTLPGVPGTPVQGDAAGAGSEGSGDAFAGVLGDQAGAETTVASEPAAVAPAVEGLPIGQVVPVLEVPTPVAPIPGAVPGATPGATPGAAPGVAPAPVTSPADEVADPGAPAPVEGPVLTSAQIIAAAQVVPIAPLLAAAAAVAAAARTWIETTGVEATAAEATTPNQVAEPVPGGEQLLHFPTEGDVNVAPAVVEGAVVERAAVERAAVERAAVVGAVVEGAAVEGTVVEGAPDLTGSTAKVTETTAPKDHAAAARQDAPAPVTGSTTLNSSVQASAPLAAQAPADGTAHTSGVTGQVFPEISRLVSRGDGTQRITLKLTPEALGDVRVVLTVRGGEVHVRMTGGELAQQALLQGAPELHRLLESVGATASRLEIGDSRSSSTDGQQSRSFDLAHEQGTTDHRTARTRDGENTMATDGATGTVRTHGSTDNATRTRTGVDVTM